jgi:hypothetical protein
LIFFELGAEALCCGEEEGRSAELV